MHRPNKFIIVTFLGIMYFVLLLYPVQYLLISKGKVAISTDNFKEPNLKKNGPLLGLTNTIEKIKTSVDNKVTNYFPLYNQIHTYQSNLDLKMNRNFYNFLGKEYVPVGTNYDGEYLYVNKDHFIIQNQYLTKELDSRLQKQIDFFNSLANYPINIAVYLPSRYEYRDLNKEVYTRQMSEYVTKFKDSLNDKITIGELEVKDQKEYMKYFYKTDHHWTSYGAKQGLDDILELFNKKNIDTNVKTIDITYHGAFARSSSLTILNDKFYDLEANLPIHDVLVNGAKRPKNYKPKVIKETNNVFYDHYINYFNGMFGLVEFNYYQEDKTNLLIFTDSYGWQIDEVLASEYNKTYVINLRYDDYKNGTFDFKKFIDDNEIKDVLFLYETGTALFDQYNYGIDSKIRR